MPVSAVSSAAPVSPTQTLPTVILAGCGYGAIAAMQALSGQARVIGINPYPYIVNSGMSTRLISGRYDSELVTIPLLDHVARYGAEFVQGRVTQINPEEKQLQVQTTEGSQWLSYDYLLLNVGRELATHGIPGVQEHTFGVRPMTDLVTAHQQVRDCWRRAAAGDLRPGLLTFVVAGGGCTGVELVGELRDLCQELSHKTGIPMSRARLILVAGDRPLVAGLSPRFGERVEQSLLRQGIEVWRPCRVQAVEADAILVRWSQDGQEERIPCLTTLWAGGLQVPQWLGQTGLPLAADGSIRVEATLQVQGSQSMLAMGDCAYFERNPGIMLPKIGVYAVRQAPIVAQNLVNLINQQPLIAYRPQKSAFISVTIGNRVAVMEKGSLVMKGYFVTLLKNLFDYLYMGSLKSVRWQDFFY